MSLGTHPFEKGLHDLGNGGYAWLQPDGGWGWSNAGLIVDGDECLIVDTLFDKPLTRDMLKAMRGAEPAATRSFDYLVNTHANADHCNGNELVGNAEIIASSACAEELAREDPGMLQRLMEQAPEMGEVGEFFTYCFSAFDFRDINRALPTRTFDDTLDVTVGDKTVHLKQVGPAHTRGDVLAFVPADRLIFTGDILFIEGHPIIWAGPVQNWIDACDYMLGLDVETVVPGHGPITDKRGIEAMRGYPRLCRGAGAPSLRCGHGGDGSGAGHFARRLRFMGGCGADRRERRHPLQGVRQQSVTPRHHGDVRDDGCNTQRPALSGLFPVRTRPLPSGCPRTVPRACR